MKKILSLFILILLLTGCSYKITKKENNQNLQTQITCAEQAQIFYNSHDKSNDFNYSFENHFNSKQNKCFVLIYANNFKDDNLFIDLYDALERKHYAMYLGHNICATTTLSLTNEPKKCQSDSGVFWFDGIDTKSPNLTIGFQGLLNGSGVGDENTLKQFIDRVQQFMNE